MLQTFQAKNITCNNCVNTIKAVLEDEFKEITINLNSSPVEVSLTIDDKDISHFKEEMANLGFDIIGHFNAKQ